MKRLVAYFFVISIFFWQCKQDAPQPKTVSDILLDRTDLSIFKAALAYTGLTDALKTGTFTLFAPSDAAFKEIGIADAAAVTAQSKENIKLILRNHILNENLPIAKMKLGRNNPVLSMSGARLYLTQENGIYLNEAIANFSDSSAANGTLYVINKVIPIPRKSLAELLKYTPEYSLFYQALRRSILSDQRLVVLTDSLASWDVGHTVFVPLNTAMEAAGLTSAKIAATSPIILARTVNYHITLGRFFTTQLPQTPPDKNFLPMFDSSNSIKIENKNGAFLLTPNSGATPSTIKQPNIFATTGIIHTIDKVLIPK